MSSTDDSWERSDDSPVTTENYRLERYEHASIPQWRYVVEVDGVEHTLQTTADPETAETGARFTVRHAAQGDDGEIEWRGEVTSDGPCLEGYVVPSEMRFVSDEKPPRRVQTVVEACFGCEPLWRGDAGAQRE